MKTSEILKAAKEVISTPEKWTKETNARNAHGDPVGALEPHATCFCAHGAIVRAVGAYRGTYAALAALDVACETGTFEVYNDHKSTTHAKVLALFDKAIAQAEAEEATQ